MNILVSCFLSLTKQVYMTFFFLITFPLFWPLNLFIYRFYKMNTDIFSQPWKDWPCWLFLTDVLTLRYFSDVFILKIFEVFSFYKGGKWISFVKKKKKKVYCYCSIQLFTDVTNRWPMKTICFSFFFFGVKGICFICLNEINTISIILTY